LMIWPKDLLGHAVHTSKITPVGDGNPQVTQGPVERIGQGHRNHSLIFDYNNYI